jgi:hypothetical protein
MRPLHCVFHPFAFGNFQEYSAQQQPASATVQAPCQGPLLQARRLGPLQRLDVLHVVSAESLTQLSAIPTSTVQVRLHVLVWKQFQIVAFLKENWRPIGHGNMKAYHNN